VRVSAVYHSAPPPADAAEPVVEPPGSLAWGPIVAGIVGAMTFGILPAFLWAGKFFSIAEEGCARLEAVAEWATRLDDSPRARQSFQHALDRVRPSRFLAVLPKLFAAFALSLLAIDFFSQSVPQQQFFLVSTDPRQSIWNGSASISSNGHSQMVHQLWVGSLLAAYILQWVHVRWYRNGVRNYVREFNRIMEKHGVLPVRMRTGAPFGALTVLGAIAFGMCGAWWGIPMMLAASAQSRYTLVTSRALAVQFADRTSRPAQRRSMERRCAAPGCRAMLPLPAKFCPQCGASVPDPMVDIRG
jgi:hypothetical protein